MPLNQTLYLMLFFVSIILLRFVDILQNNVKVAVFCLLVRVFNGEIKLQVQQKEKKKGGNIRTSFEKPLSRFF